MLRDAYYAATGASTDVTITVESVTPSTTDPEVASADIAIKVWSDQVFYEYLSWAVTHPITSGSLLLSLKEHSDAYFFVASLATSEPV